MVIQRMKEKHLLPLDLALELKQLNTMESTTIMLPSSIFIQERTNNSRDSMVNLAMSTLC